MRNDNTCMGWESKTDKNSKIKLARDNLCKREKGREEAGKRIRPKNKDLRDTFQGKSIEKQERTMSIGFHKFRKVVFSLLVILLLTVSAGAGQFSRAQVMEVSDGDTIWARLEDGNRVKICIWGIDTSEKFRSRKLFRDVRVCSVSVKDEVRLGNLASEKARGFWTING